MRRARADELVLSRTIKNAELIRVDGVDNSWKTFIEQKCDALAGLRPRLVTDNANLPGSRILEGRFTAIQQAIGTPKARAASAKFLADFVEEAKASGFVGKVIETNKVRGVNVAPAAKG